MIENKTYSIGVMISVLWNETMKCLVYKNNKTSIKTYHAPIIANHKFVLNHTISASSSLETRTARGSWSHLITKAVLCGGYDGGRRS